MLGLIGRQRHELAFFTRIGRIEPCVHGADYIETAQLRI
jgi:hypothetical protein